MKNIIYIFSFLLLFSSCEDYLEVEPKNTVVVKTYEDVKGMMGACLSVYAKGSNFTGLTPFYQTRGFFITSIYYSGQLNDEKYMNNWWATNNRNTFYSSLEWNNETLHTALWNNLYTDIGCYNTIIGELEKVSATEDEKNIIRAEAKFLRAWNLFKALQYFSPYTNNELGIPVNLNADDILSYDSSRKTQTEVYQIIIKELNEVLNYSTETSSFSLFYKKQIIEALLAEVYLFKGESGAGETSDYKNAIDHANKAMTNKQIKSLDEFQSMFSIEDNGILFDNPEALLICSPYGYRNEVRDAVCGYGLYGTPNIASQKTMDLFADNDIRNAWVDNKTGAINKFSEVMSYNPYVFFRIAEMQLIVAESNARLGNEGEAQLALETLQSERLSDYAGYTGDNILQEIMDERKREFCFEFDMVWLDMIREQKGFTRKAINDDDIDTYTLEEGDYRFTLPIPIDSELENNKIEQNPGWNLY